MIDLAGMNVRFTPQEQKISIVEIYGYENKNFEGLFKNPFYKEYKSFSNLTQLLLLIEQLQDDICYPQKGMETRRFKPEVPVVGNEPVVISEGKKPLATFKVHVLFRQSASWQGNVTWMEQGQDSPFRSVLELLFLMDSVLS